MTLALLALLPTVIVGIMDWQHYYAGAWLFPIKMKLPLAGLLLILLVFAVSVGYRATTISWPSSASTRRGISSAFTCW